MDGADDLKRMLNIHAGFAVFIAVLSVWHVGAVGLVLERVGRARAAVAHALPGPERRRGLIVGGVAIGARSFVTAAAALRGAGVVSYLGDNTPGLTRGLF